MSSAYFKVFWEFLKICCNFKRRINEIAVILLVLAVYLDIHQNSSISEDVFISNNMNNRRFHLFEIKLV